MLDAGLYAFHLVDCEIHVMFDQPVLVVELAIGGMNLPMPSLGLCLACMV